MKSTLRAGSIALILAGNAVGRAAQDPSAPPPLSAPAEAGPLANPPAVPPEVPTAPPARTVNPLLRPRTSPSPIRPAVPHFETPSRSDDIPPPLDAPAEMKIPERAVESSRKTVVSTPREDGPPALTLEAADEDAGRLRAKSGSAAGRELEKIQPELPQNKKPKRFGFFSQSPPRTRLAPPEESSIRVEPRADPAADAALKRRLETKVSDAVGDKAHGIDVRVVDRNVTIRAKVDRFWNRRAVRKTLENLPALSGYKAKIEIDD